MTEERRLIEELLPLAEIGVESSKSISYGDIHAIHTWFARRPLAACRAATFASLVPAPSTEAERDALMKLIVAVLPNKAPQERPELIEEMRRRISQAFDGRPPRVLDPFAGGGSLPLEAARLGCEAHALDLNPVAVLTLLATVDYPMRYAHTQFPLPPGYQPGGTSAPAMDELDWDDLDSDDDAEDPTPNPFPAEERAPGLPLSVSERGPGGEVNPPGNLVEAVRAWGDWILERARAELAPFYPPEPDGAAAVAYFWAKTVHCPNPSCGAEIPMLKHRWLSRRKNKPPVAYRMVPQPDRTLQVEILEGETAVADHPEQGTMAGGSVRCPFCPTTVPADDVKAQARAGQSGRFLYAVAYSTDGETGLRFRPATQADRDAYRAAAEALAVAEAAHEDPFLSLVPDEPIGPGGGRWLNVVRHGVSTWGELHNARQALALATFARLVRQAHAHMLHAGATLDEACALALYLGLTLGRLVPRQSESSRWHSIGGKVEAATGGHRLPMLWDYAESNPIGNGSSSWRNSHSWALPSIERLVGAAPSPALAATADAVSLPFPDDHFDAVLTDPPYYDSVGYSYLADMQYVWLHRALGDILPEHFAASLTPKGAEIIEDGSRHPSLRAAKTFFEDRLRQAFAEIRRVLRPGGIALVMYAHTDTSAWETLVGALMGSGLQVTASWPISTETSSRRDWLGGAVLAATIFLTCRKRPDDRVGYLDQILPEMRAEVKRALLRFWDAGIGGADFFVSAIGPALSVYSRYGEVRYAGGQPVSVANFLTLVRQAVVEHSLEKALQGVDAGAVDRETQFALLWRWTYGRQKVEMGAALLLDKATGVELAELEREGLIARANGSKKMVLQDPEEREGDLGRILRRAKAGHAPMVDAIHAACLLWRDGRRPELGELLARYDDTLRQVAQALAGLAAEESTERRLLLGLLGAWGHAVSQAARADSKGQHRPQGQLRLWEEE